VPDYIDIALKTVEGRIAFEIDGPHHYHPPDRPSFNTGTTYSVKTALFITAGGSPDGPTGNPAKEPERVKEQLAPFLADIPGLVEFDNFVQSE
jgi:hypothetical protein